MYEVYSRRKIEVVYMHKQKFTEEYKSYFGIKRTCSECGRTMPSILIFKDAKRRRNLCSACRQMLEYDKDKYPI